MKLVLIAGAALAALTVAAYAHPETRAFIMRGGDHPMDANGDGWISRQEATAAFNEMFDQLDTNHDGRLDDEDRGSFETRLNGMPADDDDCTRTVEPLEGGRDGQRVTVICEGDEDGRRLQRTVVIRRAEDLDEAERERLERDLEREIERAERDAEHATPHAERLADDAERRAEHAERLAEEIERHLERDVVVLVGDHALAPLPPMAPMPPMAPLALTHSAEADRDGDGAFSREEFVAQQLRYFDAADVDGDGRVRLPTPPAPPIAPTPPRP